MTNSAQIRQTYSNNKFNALTNGFGVNPLDIVFYTWAPSKNPPLIKVGAADTLNIFPEKCKWSADGKFNVDITIPYKVFAIYIPEGKKDITSSYDNDLRPLILEGVVEGPGYSENDLVAPLVEGKVDRLYRINKWSVEPGENTPFQSLRKVRLSNEEPKHDIDKLIKSWDKDIKLDWAKHIKEMAKK